jgi:ketosteroid isomerase-like protein
MATIDRAQSAGRVESHVPDRRGRGRIRCTPSEQAFNAGDLETLMALYDPDAALIQQPARLYRAPAPIVS